MPWRRPNDFEHCYVAMITCITHLFRAPPQPGLIVFFKCHVREWGIFFNFPPPPSCFKRSASRGVGSVVAPPGSPPSGGVVRGRCVELNFARPPFSLFNIRCSTVCWQPTHHSSHKRRASRAVEKKDGVLSLSISNRASQVRLVYIESVCGWGRPPPFLIIPPPPARRCPGNQPKKPKIFPPHHSPAPAFFF
jgi:hypothetical protein